MKVAILETGPYFDVPDITKVFSDEEKAKKAVPPGFKKTEASDRDYYENEAKERWLTIAMCEVVK